MALITDIFKRFVHPSQPPRFKVGDHVQRNEGGPLMIIISVKGDEDQGEKLMLCCKWFDSNAGKVVTNVFHEDDVKPFDWYKANSAD